MYCGDETGSFVGQVGSHTSRFGYGGDEAPRVVLNSYVGRYHNDDDNSNGNNNKNNKNNSTTTSNPFFVPASCYRARWAEADIWKTPLSGPTFPQTHDNNNNNNNNNNNAAAAGTAAEAALQRPLTDPAAYLSQGGSIADWDAYETLWQKAMEIMAVKRLKHTTGEFSKTGANASTTIGSTTNTAVPPEFACMHPLMAVAAGFAYPAAAADGSYSATAVQAARRRERVQLVELLLEKFDAPACFIATEPMVQAFSQGRSTALVVDVGAGGCRVTPVVDGLLLSTAQRRNGRGGAWFANTAWQALLPVTPLRPRYQVSHGVVDPTITAKRGIFHRWALQDMLGECLSTVQQLAPTSGTHTSSQKVVFGEIKKGKTKQRQDDHEDDMDKDNDDDEEEEEDEKESDNGMETEELVSVVPNAAYELPDGTMIDLTAPVGRDLCRLPEAYFSEALPFGTTPNPSILNQHYTLTDLPLDKLIHSSLMAVADVDVRKDLASNILLVGGGASSAATRGLEQRLSWQLRQLIPGKPKVLASAHDIERTAAGWIGGSILSSLGSFQQLWLGRTEYEEYGATLALQRFPV